VALGLFCGIFADFICFYKALILNDFAVFCMLGGSFGVAKTVGERVKAFWGLGVFYIGFGVGWFKN
jgi:hypothetical protein